MVSLYWDRQFWVATAERAIKTFAQAVVALVGTSAMGILDVDWVQLGSVAALAALTSVLTSVASAERGAVRGPSLVAEVPNGGGGADL